MVFGNVAVTVLVIFGIWIGIVTTMVIRLYRHYNRLTNGVTTKGLRDVLESVLAHFDESNSRYRDLDKKLTELDQSGRTHIGRIGVVRFNPFSDTGGTQSFTIAMLDAEDSGIVVTSLYARAGNRWYMKEIIRGKGRDVALSKEEESAIRKANSLSKTS